MKATVNIINCIILAVLAVLGVIMIAVGVKDYPLTLDDNVMIWIGIVFLLVMVLVMVITGILFPGKDTYLSDRQSIGAMIILLLSSFLNKSVINESQIDLATGKRPIHRGWEPAIGLVWLFFQGIFSLFAIVITKGSVMAIMHILSIVLIILFIIFSFIWKIEDNKEKYGEPKVKSAVLPIVIVLIIFAIGIMGGVIKTKLDARDDFGLAKIKKNIEIANEKVANYSGNIAINEEDYLSDGEIIALIRNSMNTDEEIYYKIQRSLEQSDMITFIVWTKTGNDVYWYRFIEYDEGYVYYSSMKSEALTKKDVEGKEDGIL